MNDGNGKPFDLNIEKILEDWEIYHAIREIIANALDEQLLSNSKDIEIFKDEKERWHIKDFGRGIKEYHFTQKEDEEKLKNPNVIGKFGIGLKDALATFDRKGIKVFIKSRCGDITLEKTEKHGFESIKTLHAIIFEPSDPNLIGTDVILEGCTEIDINKAKNLFLKFSDEEKLEETEYGDVLKRKGKSKIFINGVMVGQEENFLFSYNITSLTKKIRKALNRERTNVGRNAYSERIKSMLLKCKSSEVIKTLVNDLKNFQDKNLHDEVLWKDIAIYACQNLNSLERVVFLTPEELIYGDIVDRARGDGYEIIIIPKDIKEKLKGLNDISGNPMRDIGQFLTEWNESFSFKFIDEKDLNSKEKAIFRLNNKIFDLIGGKPKVIKDVKISETMRLDPLLNRECAGLWEQTNGRIIIKRDQLYSIKYYAGILLHEVAHAKSNTMDLTKGFENELSSLIGLIILNIMKTTGEIKDEYT